MAIADRNPDASTEYATKIDLDEDTRAKLVELLNQRVAANLDLYTQTKQAHWNVKGIHFFQLHELFDELAEAVQPYTDTIAERATALGGYAAGTVRMAAEASDLPEYPTDAVEGLEHLKAIRDRFAHYAAANRAAIERAEELGDAATEDMFTEIQREIDENLYFLESHLQG